MEDFQLSAPNLTAAGLLSFVVLLILTGRLVPWWTVNARVKDLMHQNESLTQERDYWRETAQKANAAALLQAQATIEQLEVGRTQEHLIAAFQDVASNPDRFARSLRFSPPRGERNAIPEAEADTAGD